MQFTKMHGLMNDFVITIHDTIPANVEQLARTICHRRIGIGADGLVFILPSELAEFRMRIFNADGSESEQCGNALRCVAKYYAERIVTTKPSQCTVETGIGIQKVWLEYRNHQVTQIRVDMGEPILQAEQVPVLHQEPIVIRQPIQAGSHTFHFTAVSMGNPHAVIEVEDPYQIPLETWGPLLEKHEWFPRRTNVEFISIQSPHEMTMRVWERGAGETMACGSGACAVVVAGVLTERCDRKVTVHLRGGDLEIDWNEEDRHVYMTGPAEYIFEGNWVSKTNI
ncbi:diaminopimelate epimerase [Thermoflavimicrobium daqui]|jgi:diaminopimelate epimerase|uniref:Diaminopimelate epimerase n=1 Tax=Thermoflavimicrobium daqui TaxID=2137476 RepID=A0A364K734_9BACL|nr:diaminopimelate epimerase [Thermoflavimicrobium daqui]RAL26103.1 diaminopimelate epimerase [Thermoflavimicrobium daqui]